MELLLTLGHNSSAIAVRDGKVIAGYEEERHERLKSSSIFPLESAIKCINFAKPSKDEENVVFVSHWFDDFEFQTNKNEKIHSKYWNQDYINSLINDYGFKVVSLGEDFTHHDAHAYAATGFYEFHGGENYDAMIMVADGFGNKQEVMSLYRLTYNNIGLRNIELFHRSYGYENSLGMFYQYATSYSGMKENQDEYKFLGYESHIHEVLNDKNFEILQTAANSFIDEMIYGLESSISKRVSDPYYIDIDALNKVKKDHYARLDKLVNSLVFTRDDDKFNLRTVIGNFIQTVLEGVATHFVRKHSNGTLIVNGGIFYNVKLNNRLAKECNSFCVMPLAGDQGAAIGHYINNIGDFDFSNLFWGHRDLKTEVSNIDIKTLPENVEIYNTKQEMADRVASLIKDNQIPQVVLGSMEFGPRALCHTTTYAIPFKENVELINTYNKRNTVMPMAPIMLRKNLDYFFDKEQYEKTIGSDGFMILTYDYTIQYCELYSGIMHKYPNEDLYSGRPQVVEDDNSTVSLILKKVEGTTKALINTSYNVHGKPIVFSAAHAIDDFKYQLDRANELGLKKPYLLIGTYEE